MITLNMSIISDWYKVCFSSVHSGSEFFKPSYFVLTNLVANSLLCTSERERENADCVKLSVPSYLYTIYVIYAIFFNLGGGNTSSKFGE